MLIYLAGPYRGDVEDNIARARQVSVQLWEEGYTVFCPHLNTAHFERDCGLPEAEYIERDLEIVARCDAVVMLPGWENSAGAREEREFALAAGIPVFEWPERPHKFEAETRYPAQTEAMLCRIMGLYRLYLAKNSDYSAAAFQVLREIGPISRLWEKAVRLVNILGYRFEVEKIERQEPLANFEGVEETLADMANLAVIALVVMDGLWGE